MNPKKHRATSGSPYEATVGFSRGVREGKLVAISGTAPIWPDGHVSPDALVQTRRCYEIAVAALEELGGSVKDVLRTRHFVTSPDVIEAVAQAHGEVFGEVRPASTIVQVAGLVDPRWLVEVEIDAVVD
ncbi:MAG: RidA family protein [Tetrasphaera sp.]|jgi:enamine deaminase RidA (YjgF/YER057c/UK114 family)|nr:RidA family protein [Tetrasphaera sp.]